jgi:hypothetical protein
MRLLDSNILIYACQPEHEFLGVWYAHRYGWRPRRRLSREPRSTFLPPPRSPPCAASGSMVQSELGKGSTFLVSLPAN